MFRWAFHFPEAVMAVETLRWYRSKVDWWIALVLCLPPMVAVGVCIALVMDSKTAELPIGILVILLVIGVYVGLIFPMKYGLDDQNLLVRFGLCRQRIPLGDISEVHPTHNPLSSPAMSLDRLHVQFGKGLFGSVMISPANREQFLDELAEKAELKREGDRLVRV
jgi:hypothetical protein